MGMGHKAPPATYRRHYWVTEHACDRFRTRLSAAEGKANNGTEHRSDDDICNVIDSLVRRAVDEGKGTNIWDDGEAATLVDIRCPDNSNDLWAIVKRNTNARSRDRHPKAIVTLLYNDMVEDSHKAGKWERTTEVVSTLRTITPAEGVNVQQQLVKPPSSSQKFILIRYTNKGISEPQYSEWADVDSAEKFLNKLRRDSLVDTNSIRVFTEAITEARIII